MSQSQPLRILHVVENLERGGLERMVVDLALAQKRAGHACRVACLFNAGQLSAELMDGGVDVVACGKRQALDLRALWRLRRMLRETRGGIVHTHNAAAHYHAALASTGLRHGFFVNTRHGMGAADPASRRERRYRTAMAGTDAVVAVCDAARERFDAQGVQPRGALLAIPNGIEIGRFAVADIVARKAVRDALGLPVEAMVIGTVGRLNWAKNQQGLIRSFVQVRREIAAACLVIVGEGTLRPELEALVLSEGLAGDVHLLGDRDDVASLLRGFDLFALSSVTEGYSMALLEAAAAGLPVVATDVGGNPEIVSDGRTGRVVPARDDAALAAGCIEILGNPVMAQAMGRAARDWVEREGTLDTMAARYESLYRSGVA